jgi:hypothetical protein
MEQWFMLVSILKWTQFLVAIAVTILAGLIWPGVMVVIPVGIGIIYIILATGACRDWKLSMWLACLMSVGVALLSTIAVGVNDFSIMRIDSDMSEVPALAVSPSGNVVQLDSISNGTTAELRRIHATAAKMQTIVATLLIFVSLGSCAVVLMHAIAWRWMIFGKVGDST